MKPCKSLGRTASGYYTGPQLLAINMISIRTVSFLVAAILNSFVASAQQSRADVCPGDDKDFATIQQRAQARDAVAQMALASCYDLGQHVKPDGKESIRWLTEAADQGYEPAEYELGRIYLYGRGIPVDYAKAMFWERKAVEQGDLRAERDLAFMYERGFGVDHDEAKSAVWYRKAAEKGDPKAQLRLAQALETGDDVPKDEQEAKLWYIKAARQEVPEAQLRLGRIYAKQGPVHCRETIEWYGRAALTGDAEPMFELGKLYSDKKCAVEGSSDAAAYKWFSLGARFGSEPSKQAAEALGPTLKPAQKRNADHAIARWLKDYAARQKDVEAGEKR